MTVEEYYNVFQGNYEEAKLRFVSDEKIKKFLGMFLKDEHYEKLCEAMAAEDYEEAFLHVHTLKGVCANLALTALFEDARELTELLRGGECKSGALESFDKVKDTYALTRKAIEELENGE